MVGQGGQVGTSPVKLVHRATNLKLQSSVFCESILHVAQWWEYVYSNTIAIQAHGSNFTYHVGKAPSLYPFGDNIPSNHVTTTNTNTLLI